MNKKIKEYAISSGITFVSAFALALSTLPLDTENMTRGAFFSLVITALRAGVKGTAQFLASRVK